MFYPNKEIAIDGENLKDKAVLVFGAIAAHEHKLRIRQCKYLVLRGVKRLVMRFRSLDKAQKARDGLLELNKQTHPSSSVQVWQIDLASLDLVKAFCDKWLGQVEEQKAIDLIFANAGLAAFSANQST
ncbi:hypothetical protein E3P77_03628 [Wallemia ichthyophaga]|nr:hypothetical protein E3P77_03628 [Wallemia ichthyophaga]